MLTLAQRLYHFQPQSHKRHRTLVFLMGLWILTMISVPIQKWVFGASIIPTAITLGLITQFIAVFYIVVLAWGLRRTIVTFAIVAFLTWLAEFIGSSTGFPFGDYTYTDLLQPQLLHVPLVIPIAWFMMLPPSWVIAQSILRSHCSSKIRYSIVFALVSALAMTAWDLFLDPQMVAWGFWTWDNPEGYFGIPWINYFGWVLTAFLVTLLIRPKYLPVLPLLTVYGIVWFLQSFGQFFFWEQQGPAIVGGIVMGCFLLVAIIRHFGDKQ